MNDRPDRCVPSLRGGSSAAGLAYRGVVLAMLLSSIAFTRNAAESAPVSVRFPEGLTHGFLLVRSAAGDIVGHGELTQTVKEGGVAESRLVFRFKDGSLHDEKVAFSQQRVFTLIRYQLTQRGPSFPEQMDVVVDRGTSTYEVRAKASENGAEKVLTGKIDLPKDANGNYRPSVNAVDRSAKGHATANEARENGRAFGAQMAANAANNRETHARETHPDHPTPPSPPVPPETPVGPPNTPGTPPVSPPGRP